MNTPENFQDKRKKFMEENKVDIPSFANKKVYASTTPEKYTSKSKISNKRKRKINKKRLTALLGATGIAALAVFGGIKVYTNSQVQNEPITLVEALNNGETLESLDIDQNIQDELLNLQAALENEDITNSELIALSTRINDLQFDTIKTKLAKNLGVEESDIHLSTVAIAKDEGRIESTEKISVDGGKTYTRKDWFKNKNTMTDEIGDYIKNIGDMQRLMGQIQNGDINRQDIINQYKEVLQEIDQMAASEMTIDENGNISVEQVTQKNLEEKNQQTSYNKIEENDQEMER